MRICLVYDCLYPYTVGGAERWYRNLAEELALAGHDVTYLTRDVWEEREPPDIPGVQVVGVSKGGPLYTPSGRRRIGPPLRFGIGVLLHVLRNRRKYEAFHTCAFPFFSLPALRLALLGRRRRLAVDWFEVWTREYWREYLGPAGGRVGHGIQRACILLTPRAFVFSRLHEQRLRAEGLRGEVTRLAGLYSGDAALPAVAEAREPLVVFAGRLIREKRADLLPAAIATARHSIPRLRGLVIGDGPERPAVLEAIAAAGLEGVVEAPGFVETEAVGEALLRATCHVLPSAREGYGLVVIEAAAAGTPSVVVAAPDNAAVELVEEGVNGFIVEPDREALAAAIVRVHEAGEPLRASTSAWFSRNARRLSAAESARSIAAGYSNARS